MQSITARPDRRAVAFCNEIATEAGMIPRVYLDNVITSGRVTKDLESRVDPNAMESVDQIFQLHDEGRIQIVSSRQSHREQERTKNPQVRAALLAHRDAVPLVETDHRLLGFSHVDYGALGFTSSPMITDIIDEQLFAKLKAAGLSDGDAK